MKKAYLLADHKKLKVKQTDTGVFVSLPENAPDKIASVLVLEIKDTTAKVAAQK